MYRKHMAKDFYKGFLALCENFPREVGVKDKGRNAFYLRTLFP